MAYTKHTATQKAVDVVIAALGSGSIKLNGSNAEKSNAEGYAIADAAYLSRLIGDLSASLQSE
jgi:hypothetical protein